MDQYNGRDVDQVNAQMGWMWKNEADRRAYSEESEKQQRHAASKRALRKEMARRSNAATVREIRAIPFVIVVIWAGLCGGVVPAMLGANWQVSLGCSAIAAFATRRFMRKSKAFRNVAIVVTALSIWWVVDRAMTMSEQENSDVTPASDKRVEDPSA